MLRRRYVYGRVAADLLYLTEIRPLDGISRSVSEFAKVNHSEKNPNPFPEGIRILLFEEKFCYNDNIAFYRNIVTDVTEGRRMYERNAIPRLRAETFAWRKGAGGKHENHYIGRRNDKSRRPVLEFSGEDGRVAGL